MISYMYIGVGTGGGGGGGPGFVKISNKYSPPTHTHFQFSSHATVICRIDRF